MGTSIVMQTLCFSLVLGVPPTLPSGKHTKNLWNITMLLMGKIHYFYGHFSIVFVSHNQRVRTNLVLPCFTQPFSWRFHRFKHHARWTIGTEERPWRNQLALAWVNLITTSLPVVITGWWLMMVNDGEYKEVEYHPYTYIIYIYIYISG